MRFCLRLIVLASFAVMPQLTSAQDAAENPMEIGESGEAYLKAIRLRGVNSDVAYFDPDRPPPPMDTRQDPEPPSEPGEWSLSGDVEFPTLLISAAVLIAVAYVFVRFGSGFAVSFGREADNAARGRGDRTKGSGSLAPSRPGSLKAILRIQDRRAALIQLSQSALSTAILTNGVLLQRSWTARDALRHLPEDQNCLDALRKLVLASERVHFGGRDVSEDEFQAHVDGIRPLLTGVPQ